VFLASRTMPTARFREICFARAARSYESEAQVQRLLADRCAAACPSLANRVLELGCGTGLLTRELRRRLPQSSIIATDSVPGMLDQARGDRDSKPALFALQDASGASAACSRVRCFAPYDLVTSSALLQWIPDQGAHLRFVGGLVRLGGTYVFSAFTRTNLPELNRILAEPPFSYESFPGVEPERIQTFAAQSGWRLLGVHEMEDHETLPTPIAALRHLRAMGASRDPRQGGRLTRATLGQLLRTYTERHSVAGGVSLTWRSCTAVLERVS
jgi:malonyl-CoA O-methyltransferase